MAPHNISKDSEVRGCVIWQYYAVDLTVPRGTVVEGIAT